MTIAEACDSLKLEAALRELGFVVIKDRVVVNAGVYFVRPVGFTAFPDSKDLIRGFQVAPPRIMIEKFDSISWNNSYYIKESAKQALDWATAF